MHILHISPYYVPAYSFGGVVSMLEGLAQAQLAQGHQVTVLTTDAYSLEQSFQGNLVENLNGVQVIRCPNRIYPLRRFNLSTPQGIRQQAQSLIPQVDIIHLHEFRTVENVLVSPITTKHSKPIVLSPHGTLTYSTGRSLSKSVWDKIISPQIAKHIQHVVSLADAEQVDAQALWQQFSNSRPAFSVIPNGVNLSDYDNLPDGSTFREKYHLGDDRIILFMGRLHQRKGVDLLAKAFKQANLPNTKLVFAGSDDGMQAILETLINEHIILTGFLNGDERLAALAAADIFVLPAIGEGISMASLEAMAAAVPAVLSTGCNLPEVAEVNAGLVIEPTIANLTDALQDMFSDNAQLEQMGENARNLIAQKFTWDKIASQLEAVYNSLIMA